MKFMKSLIEELIEFYKLAELINQIYFRFY